MARRSGLGKGLNALLPDAAQEAPDDTMLRELPVAQIRPNPYQPRAVFDEESLQSLSASIATLGVLQPILVRPLADSSYELVAGERRWRAAQLAGLDMIPALVRDVDDTQSLQEALVENLHREDLNPLEEAAGYQQLIDDFSMTQDQIAEQVGRSRSAVANLIRLLQLPPSVQQFVAERSLSAGHARALLAIESVAEQENLAARVVSENLSVRETEDAVRRLVAAHYAGTPGEESSPAATPSRPAALLELEQLLGEHLDTRVAVSMAGKRGRIVVEFADLEDLERVYRAMVEGRPATEG
jgi:ParB family transcriptional regulator, chromosome partitioning protein